MSVDALTVSYNRIEAVYRAARHVRLWLAATELAYDAAAREVFVRAHPLLFGHAYELTVRGFERWRSRHRVNDTVDGFARYIARRHQGWLDSHGYPNAMPPCLVGTANAQPCWHLPDGHAAAEQDHIKPAA